MMPVMMMASGEANNYDAQDKQVLPKHVKLPKASTDVCEAACRFNKADVRVSSSIDISVFGL
jgi:hypothetical protein